MGQQRIINLATYHRMRDALQKEEWLDIYRAGNSYPAIAEEDLLGTTITLPDEAPILSVESGKTESDTENAIKIYSYLGELSRTQAVDSRLWVTLTHTTFWEYCRKRWDSSDLTQNYALEHWFESKKGGLAVLRRNAISRLWWAAYLTMAPWEKDDELKIFKTSNREKYTRVLLSQAQIFQDIMERGFGSNLRMRICILDALDKNLNRVSNKDKLSKDISEKLTLLLKHRQLDAMNLRELQEITHSVVEASASRLSGI